VSLAVSGDQMYGCGSSLVKGVEWKCDNP